MNTNKALTITVQEMTDVLVSFIQQLGELLGHGQVTSMIYHEATQSLLPGPGCDIFPEVFQYVLQGIVLGMGCCGLAALEGSPVVVADTRTNMLWRPFLWAGEQAGIRSVWSTPIKCEGHLYGTFDIYHSENYTPDTRETKLVQWVAEQAAVTLHRLQLQKSEEYYKSLFDNHQMDMLFTVDCAGNFVSVNTAASSMTGYSVEELLSKSVMELPSEEDVQHLLEQFHAALKGQISQMQMSITRKDGTPAQVEITSAPIVVHGQMLGMYGVAKNVTEQSEILDLLNYVEKIDGIGIWTWNFANNSVRWSEGMYRIYGVQKDSFEINRELVWAFVHDEDKATVQQAMQACLRGTPCDIEHRICIFDGTERMVQVRGDAILDSAGKPIYLIGIVREITEANLERQKAADNELHYKSLEQYNPNGIFSLDLSGKFTRWNPAFGKMLGYSVDELNDMVYTDVLFPAHSGQANPSSIFTSRDDVEKNVQCTFRHKDGSRVEAVCTTVPIVVDEQRVGTYSIVKDLSAQQQADELVLSTKKLSVIGQLAAGVAHEIRNPLTTVKGFVQLLKVVTQAESKNKYIQIVENELNRIDHIVDAFLVLAKPQTTEFSFCNLTTILDDVITLMNPEAALNNVEIMTGIESSIPMIRCETNRLKQVFVNVMKNAIEAMPTGGKIFVLLKTVGEHVMIEIKDQGQGIEEERLKTITEPFYTTKEKGTGLGLMISRKIIEAHDGELEITSKISEGTTVKIVLPVA